MSGPQCREEIRHARMVHLIVGADDEAIACERLNPITCCIETGEEERFVGAGWDAGGTVHGLAVAGAVEEHSAR